MSSASKRKRLKEEELEFDGKKHRHSHHQDGEKDRRPVDRHEDDDRLKKDERRDSDAKRKNSTLDEREAPDSQRKHDERSRGEYASKSDHGRRERHDERQELVERKASDGGEDKGRKTVEDGSSKRIKPEPDEEKQPRRRWDAADSVKIEQNGSDDKAGNGQVKVQSKGGLEAAPSASALPPNFSTDAAQVAGSVQVLGFHPQMAQPTAAIPPKPSPAGPVFVKGTVTSSTTSASSVPPAGQGPSGAASTSGPPKALASLDALQKAKLALEKQKLLNQKMKRLPQLAKLAAAAARPPLPASTVAPLLPQVIPGTVPGTLPGMMPGIPAALNLAAAGPNLEAIQRASLAAARLGFQPPQVFGIPGAAAGAVAAEETTAAKPPAGRAPLLRLDAHGREIDEQGRVIERPKAPVSTLKVNQNKQKREAFKILHPELEEDPVDNPFFDPRMSSDKKKLVRPRRGNFQFVEEGKFSKMAEMQRLRAKFGEERAAQLRLRQAAMARAAAQAAAEEVNPNFVAVGERVIDREEKRPKDPIPEVEWWDAKVLENGTYDDVGEGNEEGDVKVKTELITVYVEHPVPIEPPAEPPPPPPQPLKLTKREQKKLRTQRRLAREKDRQEMVRQGLLEPPKPKIKMSNLMRVLGVQAVQDPTKLEREVRDAAAEREQAHVDRNMARKLTPAEKREKKERKLFDDPSAMLETLVCVFRIKNLTHPQLRFKVDINAQENRLTGCAVMSDEMSVVVVEGGSKAIKRYSKLMLRRIDWNTKIEKNVEEEEEPAVENQCVCVWQGSVARSSFDNFTMQQCRSTAACRKVLADAGVGHYWDLAVNFVENE